jgi:hypothetical protein
MINTAQTYNMKERTGMSATSVGVVQPIVDQMVLMENPFETLH